MKISVKKVMNEGQWRSKKLITHYTSIVTFMCRLGSGLGHVVSNHVIGAAVGCNNMTKFHMLTAHMHAHIDMASGRLVGGVKTHGNGAFVVEVNRSGLRVAEAEMLEKHAEVERLFSSLRTSDVFAFLRAEESSTA